MTREVSALHQEGDGFLVTVLVGKELLEGKQGMMGKVQIAPAKLVVHRKMLIADLLEAVVDSQYPAYLNLLMEMGKEYRRTVEP